MIDKNDLNRLILLQAKLLELKSLVIGNVSHIMGLIDENVLFFDNENEFIRLMDTLVEYKLAVPEENIRIGKRYGVSPNTHHIKIENIFKAEQDEKQKEELRHKYMTENLKPKVWRIHDHLPAYGQFLVGALLLLFSVCLAYKKENCEKIVESQKKQIDSLRLELLYYRDTLIKHRPTSQSDTIKKLQ